MGRQIIRLESIIIIIIFFFFSVDLGKILQWILFWKTWSNYLFILSFILSKKDYLLW